MPSTTKPTPIATAAADLGFAAEHALPDSVERFLFSEDRLTLVACGTASYACLTAKYWFEQLAGLPCEVDIASEFRYREPPLPAKSFALFVSQSGETADTLAALELVTGGIRLDRLMLLQANNALKTFAESTGGKHFPVTFAGEIPSVLQSISALVRNQYSLGYTPTNTRKEGKRRKIQVKVNLGDQIDPKLVVIQHRQSYVEEKTKK